MSNTASNSEWVWMPHAGHLIVGNDCRFHLNTMVNGFIVSTVGEYLPDSDTRDMLATHRGKPLEGRGDARRADWMRKFGYEKIGCDRLYETMVFKATASAADQQCCPFSMESGENVDFEGYNDPAEARCGHMRMCDKYAAIKR